MILSHMMRSDMPVHLEHFLQLGRRLQNIRNRDGTKVSEPCALTCSAEDWFLDNLDPRQVEHFRDWLLINSTCRSFRAWGKKAFFSEKIFLIRPPLMKTLSGETGKIIATARACIRHVIAPSPPFQFTAGELIFLPRYHALQCLRSLSIQPSYSQLDILSQSSPILQRNPLPEEFSSLLRNIGLRVDQLHVDLLCAKDEGMHRYQMELLADEVYLYLRVLSARKARGGFQGSDDTDGERPSRWMFLAGSGFSIVPETSAHITNMLGAFQVSMQ